MPDENADADLAFDKIGLARVGIDGQPIGGLRVNLIRVLARCDLKHEIFARPQFAKLCRALADDEADGAADEFRRPIEDYGRGSSGRRRNVCGWT